MVSDGVADAVPASNHEPLPDADAFDAYSRTVSGVAERLIPSVAHLAVSRRTRRGRAEGAGSGVAISSDGYMLTSAHVVAGGHSLSASFADGRELSARSPEPIPFPTWPCAGGRSRSDAGQAGRCR